jgi:predicted nucleic acid-binding protein
VNYLLDTNHWVHIQRRHPAIMAHLNALPAGSSIYMPVVAQAELLVGVETIPNGKRKSRLRELYEESVATAADTIPIDSRVAERFAAISAQLRADGTPISTNDIWIGAIALVANMTVASTDAHMGYIRGLRVENWTAQPA